jgi:hypothetical protein
MEKTLRSVIIANVLAGLCCLAMVGCGFVILLVSQMDSLHPDHFGMALGSALLGAFLVIPALSIARSIRLASSDRRASIAFALAPFAFIALAVVGMRTAPWPSPPQQAEPITHYPDTPETYFWKLTRWRFGISN